MYNILYASQLNPTEDEPITENEMRAVIAATSRNMAAGRNRITNTMIRNLSDKFLSVLLSANTGNMAQYQRCGNTHE